MEKVKLSKRVFKLVFADKAEARAFRNADYSQQLARNIAKRAEHRAARAAGKMVARPSKLPRRPQCVDVSWTGHEFVAVWCAKHADYWRTTCVPLRGYFSNLPK